MISFDERDDRTVRAVAAIVGEDTGPLVFSHFTETTVGVVVEGDTLRSRTGWMAVELALNMLTRFVGGVELSVDGGIDDELQGRIDLLLSNLVQIDSRPGKRITLVQEQRSGSVLLRIGPQRGASTFGDRVVSIGCTEWKALVRGGSHSLQWSHSAIPFGALCAVCFGVAEVFKHILIVATADARSPFPSRRLVADFVFDSWHALPSLISISSGPTTIPVLSLDGVVLVGGGAVGNAVLYALSHVETLTGELQLVDGKCVTSKNLNRCLYFRESSVGLPKVRVLEAAVAGRVSMKAHPALFDSTKWREARVFISTVDNNDVRHSMQETVPELIVQGSTGDTKVTVSVHSGVDGRSCLVCRHPDRLAGLPQRAPLSLEVTAAMLGVTTAEIARGEFGGSNEITDELVNRMRLRNPAVGSFLAAQKVDGNDLCGAVGQLREAFGTTSVPIESSVPFVSAFAGIMAAAQLVKHSVSKAELSPEDRNVLTIDLAADYSRRALIAIREPARADCSLCVARRDGVRDLYAEKWGSDAARLQFG